jgi:hypothetical protein
MALRKETMVRRAWEALQGMLEPGEQVAAASLAESGPSVYLALVSAWLRLLLNRPYYMAVTDRRVMFVRLSKMTYKPKRLEWSDPRAAVAIVENSPGSMWSHMRYRRPDGSQMRLNYYRTWRDDMAGVIQALGTGAQFPQVQPQVAPQSYQQPPQQGGFSA